jgi:hypothetical protein
VTIRRLSVLQWLGLVGGAGVWFASFVGGVGVSQAVCNPGGKRWGVPFDTVEIALAAVAFALLVAAELASVVVFRATRDVGEEDPPPPGRLHFFASAALVANLLFLLIVVLSTVATVVNRTCHQA